MIPKQDPKVLEEASHWYARLLAPDCTARDRSAFAAWRSDPVHARAYTLAQQLAETLSRSADHPRLQALADQALSPADTAGETERGTLHQPQPGPYLPRHTGHRKSRWSRPVALAAGLAIVAISLSWITDVTSPYGTPVVTVYETRAGERQTFTLDDGTVIEADVATRLTATLGPSTREVELVAGRALFSVAHDPSRPFSVQAQNTRTVALGTRFQVQHRQNAVLIALTEGSVEISGGAGGSVWRDRLVPGEQLTLEGPAAAPRKQQVDAQLVTSWSRGRLLFRGTPLAEALEEINRYAAIPVRLGDPSLGDMEVGGNFIAGDSRSIVSAFAAVLPLTVVESGDELVLFRRHDIGS